MVKINWSDAAFDDLKEIEEYIAKDSIIYAIRTITKIEKRTEILRSFPKFGRKVPELENENIRELIEGNYRIVYFLKNRKEIIILRVHHSARLFKL
jgi:plasmid stabilization system protein ParE